MAGPDDRTLDIKEAQVLVHFAPDPNGLTDHHRILLCRVSPGRWVAASPDFELGILDLNTQRHTVLRRRAAFPGHLLASTYAFDPISRNELEELRRDAKAMAAVLGDDDDVEQEALVWVFSNPSSDKVGVVVDRDISDQAVTLGNKGLVEINGEVETIEEIPQSKVADYAKERKGGLGDLRTIGHHVDENGKRHISLPEAFALLRQTDFKDWGFSGPRAVKEYLSSIRDSATELPSYHVQWLQASGANPRSALVNEHKIIIECLRLALSRDQLDISNLQAFELLTRRAIQLEIAVSRNPSNPEFSGLETLLESPLTTSGAAKTRELDLWLTDRLKEKAQIQKQTRLFREEHSYANRDKGSHVNSDDHDAGGGGGWRKKKRAKAKAAPSTGGAGGLGSLKPIFAPLRLLPD